MLEGLFPPGLERGIRSVSVPNTPVSREDDVPLGSPARREERVRRSREKYDSRWGAEQAYCFDMSAEATPDAVRREFEILLGSARSGHDFTVLAGSKAHREIVRAGLALLHANIVVERLPLLFASRAAARIFARLRRENPDIRLIRKTGELFLTETNEKAADAD